MIQNPVLCGFHPDPCMIFANGAFYLANSTFEYYPGVKLSKSADLANWETVGYPLKDHKHIDMKGNPSSTGVWAPCISYHEGKFYLVYTDVKTWERLPFKDSPNYITWTDDPAGEWSDPVYVNSSGFDPSLFHDADGRTYFVNMEWDYRAGDNKNFTGILLTELDSYTLKPISMPVKIYTGTERGCVEGPHLYHKDGWYYLFTAEGGTSYEHAETVARSRNIAGPYETHPDKHLITAFNAPQSPLQKTGHASLCQAADGRWWLAFLCGRPMDESMRCPLGRETGIAEIVWQSDWPYLKEGGCVAPQFFKGYGEPKCLNDGTVDFTNPRDMLDFQSLRVPARTELLPDGALRIWGGESLLSTHQQNMLVRRQDSFVFRADMTLRYEPKNFRQMAGLIYRYNEENQFFLRVSFDEHRHTRVVGLLRFDKYRFSMTKAAEEIDVGQTGLIWLRLSVHNRQGKFSCSTDGVTYTVLKEEADVSVLSDEYATPLGFTGAFVGMQAVDLDEHQTYCDFLSFSYVRGKEN
ncbi:MAG: glycoside hydrolase family 43 protein [Clostridia bacterium]